MFGNKILEQLTFVPGFIPVDLQTANNTGKPVSLKNYAGCLVILFKAVGTDNDDPTLQILQGTDVAFATNKDLDVIDVIYRKESASDLPAVADFTRTTQTADATFTVADSAQKAVLWIFDVKSADLDTDNGYDVIRADVADVGGNPQLGCLLYMPYGCRYPQRLVPDAISD